MYCVQRHTAVKVNHNTREMTRVSCDKLQADTHRIRHSCARRNTLEKGVDDGQKKRWKQILLCRVNSCLLVLDQTRRGAAKL